MLIGLMGRKRAGKDTFAAALVNDFQFTKLAFADVMKSALLEFDPVVTLHGLTVSDYVDQLGWEVAKERPGVRRALQDFGSAVRNNVGANVWVDPVRREVTRLQDRGRDVVVSDVRYLNEAHMIRDMGGVLVSIVRPGVTHVDAHPSEADIPFHLSHITILNDGTESDLTERAQLLLDHVAPSHLSA